MWVYLNPGVESTRFFNPAPHPKGVTRRVPKTRGLGKGRAARGAVFENARRAVGLHRVRALGEFTEDPGPSRRVLRNPARGALLLEKSPALTHLRGMPRFHQGSSPLWRSDRFGPHGDLTPWQSSRWWSPGQPLVWQQGEEP